MAKKTAATVTESDPRRAHRLEVAAREQRTHQPLLDNVVHTAGLPLVWARALKAAAPVVGTAASGLVASFHPDSPGGSRPTLDELEAIAESAARDFKAALLREFGGDLD